MLGGFQLQLLAGLTLQCVHGVFGDDVIVVGVESDHWPKRRSAGEGST